MFDPFQFTPTQWDSSADKAKFANHFIRFVESGFNWGLFPKWFYKRLSMTFGHIAHYNQQIFYDVWFRTPQIQAEFLSHAVNYNVVGDPTFTYSDVEKELKKWILFKEVNHG
jgi:hypothetical protein